MTTLAQPRPRNRLTGFTLVELAIVLLIVTLLLGGLLPTISSQIEQRHVTDTRKQLDEIQQALIGFAVVNGRLPCPADGATPAGQANAAGVAAGQEYTTGGGSTLTCVNNTGAGANQVAWGAIPWATLGLSETDAWGRRFTYRVTTAYADGVGTPVACTPSAPAQSSFALCSAGNLTVLSKTGGTSIALNVPAVVVSHGTDGLGAYTPAGTQLPGATVDQGYNANNNAANPTNLNFVSHDPTPTFDDLVVWISPNTLMNRMVTAGKLP